MKKLLSFAVITVILSMVLFLPLSTAYAKMTPTNDMINAEKIIEQSLNKATNGDLEGAQKSFQAFKSNWRNIEDGIKQASKTAYKDIEAEMGKTTYAFSRASQEEVVTALKGLKAVNEKFIAGGYPKDGKLSNQNISLAQFISYLQVVKDKAGAHDQNEAIASMNKVVDAWLNVEGVVVSQSAQVYSNTERDMVIVQAMLSDQTPNYDGAIALLNQMIQYLSPLAAKANYTMWDAAMIIIREGLEALLVVVALLAFVNKSNVGKGKGFIWSGISLGIFVSVILAIIIKLIFSSGAFGNNNALIAGWTGIIAAIMLLYVSYWLHSNSNIKHWQQFIKSKTETALNSGRLFSLGIISFLAIFREGTETVLFFLGMVNQISMKDLFLGLGIGFGILFLLAYFMIFIGVKLPIRPFFIVSSIIVFYLTVKFLGMGIHSLQLAGVIPTTNLAIPSIDLVALYPSWESTLPQLILVVLALVVVFWKRRKVAK